MFHNRYDQERWEHPTTPVGPIMRMRDIHDGTSQTLLYSETAKPFPFSWLHAGPEPLFAPWYEPRAYPGRHFRPSEYKYIHGFVWHHVDDGLGEFSTEIPDVVRINGGHVEFLRHHPFPAPSERRTIDDLFWLAAVARPSSNHAGGVNMAFADGRVKFVQDTVGYRVYQALMTPFGKNSDVPFKEYRLQDY